MPGRDLCLLSLDGGGVRGLSSLSILKKLMENIHPESPPKPCDYFDMIGGTSTGGLMAIMLGCLEMDIDECISAYTTLSDRVFQKQRHRIKINGQIQGRFDAAELERSVKEVIVQKGLQEDALLKRSDNACCKVFVCATSKETADTVHFRTYPSRGSSHLFHATRIWEAARATSAASSFFDPIKIGPYDEEFVDGATGANNPIQELWNEAKSVWSDKHLESNIQCLVSIGTGVPSLKPFGSSLVEIGKTLVQIATETERTAETFHRGHSELDDDNRYFRFNVLRGLEGIGLEDTSQKNVITAATSRYTESEAIVKQMKLCGKNLLTREYDGLYKINFSMRGWSFVNHFVTRDKELEQLEQTLLPRPIHDMRRKVLILHGLGGIGKTQLAVAFSRKYKKTYSSIFWLNGGSKDQVRQSLAEIARRLPEGQISEFSRTFTKASSEDLDIIINEVQNWFSRPANNRWLLIFDNVDRDHSPELPSKVCDLQAFDVEDYFPGGDHGSILVTSRLRRLRQYGDSLELTSMNEHQGKAVLETRIGRSLEGLEQIVHLLGGLPLALAHAGSYMQETGITVADYIASYQNTWKALFDCEMISLKEYPNRSVQSTWTLSYEHVKKRDPDAAKMLDLWAHLDSSDLWYELFTPILSGQIVLKDKLPEWFARTVHEKTNFTQRIRTLLNYSLVETQLGSSAYSMHPVVREWCFHTMTENKDEVAPLAIMAVGSACPLTTEREYWLLQQRLLPHCKQILRWLQSDLQSVQDYRGLMHSLSESFDNLGNLYRDQGKLKEAEKMYQQALKGYEKALGVEHTSTLNTVNNLGNLYTAQGKLKEAEEMYQQALKGKEKMLDVEHTSTLSTVNNLGSLYQNQGKLKEAEEMYQRALKGYEKALGVEHTSTLTIVNNLGNLYTAQGKLKEAEEMYQRAFKGKEKVLGVEHTSTLSTVNNLGGLYHDQGKLKEAEEMYQQALKGYEKALGVEHTSTLITVNNLGSLYQDQGKLKEAEEMYQQALKGFEKVLNVNHTSTLNTVNNLGSLYQDQGKLKEAEEMYQQALMGYEEALGVEHTFTVKTAGNLRRLRNERA
ncbi:MAG: hypothetical protein M1827_006227 [Pycnora praestabilis]|nr:MAG: hypothetical protein M1827_006227 [Pycnora praestabilis]